MFLTKYLNQNILSIQNINTLCYLAIYLYTDSSWNAIYAFNNRLTGKKLCELWIGPITRWPDKWTGTVILQYLYKFFFPEVINISTVRLILKQMLIWTILTYCYIITFVCVWVFSKHRQWGRELDVYFQLFVVKLCRKTLSLHF